MDFFPQEICDALQDIDVDAFVTAPAGRAVEIAEGPIRQVISIDGCVAGCCGEYFSFDVSDERIQRHPQIYIRSSRVKEIPLIGPIRDIRWKLGTIRDIDQPLKWTDRKRKFGNYVVGHMALSKDIRDRLIRDGADVGIGLETGEQSWSIFPWGEIATWEIRPLLSRQKFELYKALVRALLAMPMPAAPLNQRPGGKEE